jgi:ATP-dependent protease ClpP protease subunit
MTDENILELRGPVGGETFNVSQVRDFLAKADGRPVRVILTSHGGDSATSCAIHAAFKNYPGELSALIHYAGSAAVLPALAASQRAILSGGSFFLHRGWTVIVGMCADLQGQADRLRELDNLDARYYADATGQEVETIIDYMEKSTLLDAAESVRLGFAHEILDQPGGQLRKPDVWHEVASVVVDHAIHNLSPAGQTTEAVQRRGMAVYTAGQSPEWPCAPFPAGGWPATTPGESAEQRRRQHELLDRLRQRLDGVRQGLKPDPRRSPITASWRCSACHEMNFHPPGRDGRPTPCIHCENEDTQP